MKALLLLTLVHLGTSFTPTPFLTRRCTSNCPNSQLNVHNPADLIEHISSVNSALQHFTIADAAVLTEEAAKNGEDAGFIHCMCLKRKMRPFFMRPF